MESLEDILKSISEAETQRDLWTFLLDVLHHRGVKRVSYHAANLLTGRRRIVSDGFPKDWVSEYIDHRYIEIDPIPELAARMAEPFFWHDIGSLADYGSAGDAYLDAMKRAKLGDGLALYVFGPGLRNAYVGLGFGVERLDLDKHHVFRLQCIVQAAHLRFCALPGPRTEQIGLTKRETDVLRWIARGKSNSVIAELLGISPHTVDAHLRSIYRKLDVADRTTAAVRALGAGIVQYPDPVGTG